EATFEPIVSPRQDTPSGPPPELAAQFAALQRAAEALSSYENSAVEEEDFDPANQRLPVENLLSELPADRLPPYVEKIARSCPRIYVGEDRLRFYCNAIDAMDVEKREHLRDFLDSFVARMHSMGASDMDIGGPACVGHVWFRVDGDKCPYDELGSRSNDEIDIVILNLLSPKQREDLFTHQSADFSHYLSVPGTQDRRFRCTVYFDNQNLGLCMRAINENVRKLESIGFHPIVQRGFMFRNVRHGLVLFTGVTGSGKSTTLDAIIDANNHDFHGHIVIVAKPIEYMHAPDKCIIRHREVGADVPSFKDGVTQALRQDPDIIMIGEMRDPETISSAIEAADTGHKVFSTLHTSSAVESLDRIVAEYPTEEQNRIRMRLADVLSCVVSQKLAPRVGGGRVLVKEVLWVTANVKAAIMNGNTGEIYQMMWEGGKQGMITLEQDLFRLVRERKITPEIAIQYANNKRRLKQLLQ
ncbi:MAG: PilT/PilU family type 4a pilus ATPase, partial [Rubricoccaceae bacterium]|nr:PilT/PilU family type 4a pilus ATPase [Rubricoccaceae bacterium]